MSSNRAVISWVEWMTVLEVKTSKAKRKHFIVVVDGWKCPRFSDEEFDKHFTSFSGVTKGHYSWKFRSRLKANQAVTMALLKWGTR